LITFEALVSPSTIIASARRALSGELHQKAFAKIANEAGAVPELVRQAAIVAGAETPADDHTSFALSFRSALKPELHAAFVSVLADLPPPKLSEPVARSEADDDDDTDRSLLHPGIFGRQKALRDAEKLLIDAERQRTLGNRTAAKALAIKALEAVQKGEWGMATGGDPSP